MFVIEEVIIKIEDWKDKDVSVHLLSGGLTNTNFKLMEKYIDDGKQTWSIDYEYSGNNDPCFELGNSRQEMQFNGDQIHKVCMAYFGAVSADKIARVKLNTIMPDVGWGWAIERWGRAEQKMNSAEFEGWLWQAKT